MPEWKISQEPVPYEEALAFMDERVAAIHAGRAEETVWLLEHPPLYTAGTSAKDSDLLEARFPVYKTGRGGEYTYHGPGQRVAYVMMDLKKRGKPDIRRYVCDLEEWIIRTLAEFGIAGERREGRVGIWVDTFPHLSSQSSDTLPLAGGGKGWGGEKKIAAIGVRVRRWVTLHGIAINVDPDLTHFDGIVPCGISDYGVTSMAELNAEENMETVDTILKEQFGVVFS